MKDIDRRDLIDAVLASRDEIDAELESDLLKAIVDAEINFSTDGDAAMTAINAVVTAAVNRSVGRVHEPDAEEPTEEHLNGDHGNEENRA